MRATAPACITFGVRVEVVGSEGGGEVRVALSSREAVHSKLATCGVRADAGYQKARVG